MYRMLGVSAILGMVCFPLSAPGSVYIGKHIYRQSSIIGGFLMMRRLRQGSGEQPRCKDRCNEGIPAGPQGHQGKQTFGCRASLTVSQLNAWQAYFRRRIEHLRVIELLYVLCFESVPKVTGFSWLRWRFTLGTIFNLLADSLPNLAVFVTFFFHTKVLGRTLDAPSAFVAFTLYAYSCLKRGLS